jgi:glucose 1-dehydrogenase
MNGLKDKNVLVTGASGGIGQAIALEFAKEGANVIINYRGNQKGAEETQREATKFGVKTLIINADVAKEDNILRMFDQSLEEFGTVDILVNNAAIQNYVPSHERTTENFDKTIGVNLRGPFICAREAIKHFLGRNYPGVIINISSPHEIIPKPGYIDYAMSKAGMINLTKTLALEYAHKGIRVNSVVPGAVITPMNNSWIHDPQKKAAVEKHIPMLRAAMPDEISPSVCFLASDDARYITGTSLFVDGGAALYPEYRDNWSS